jgi:hypothetical protein
MRTPPFLLGATLLFWGWQIDLLLPGAILAVILEGSRFITIRWDLSDDDFKRIWTFCALLFLGAAVYAFADNGGPEGFGRFFREANLNSERDAGSASARTAAALIRWLPMVFFLFVSGQVFSTRQVIPLHAISLILQWRRKHAKARGQPLPPARSVDATYPYFAVCLFAASVHPNKNDTFFWGLCVLLAWALWWNRPRRFGPVIWATALAIAIALGYSGARGIGLVQRYVESINVQFLADWLGRSRTDPSINRAQIGKIGRIKTSARIMIRLEPKSGEPPSYLREASYRVYHSSIWSAGHYRNRLNPVHSSPTNESTYTLLSGEKPNASRVGILCYLTGRSRDNGYPEAPLPLPSGTTRLENMAFYGVNQNNVGAVVVDGPGLVQFDAIYGPGATIDGPPETNPAIVIEETNVEANTWRNMETNGALDLLVPTNEVPALEKVVAELGLRSQNRDQAVRTISQFFATKFTYRMWQDADLNPEKNPSPLGRFLLETRAGHCEYFATATVLLLREIGIPARYAVGYSVHEAAWSGYIVRQRDAHAWALVWNEKKKIWENLDTTPGSWLEAESKSGASVWLADVSWWIRLQFAKFRWGQTHLRQYILLGLVPVLILLLLQIIRQRKRGINKDARSGRAITWPGVDSEFYEIEKQLGDRCAARKANETLTGWLERVAADSSLAELREPLLAILRLHYRYRFDPLGLEDSDRLELRRQTRACLDKLSHLEPAPSPAL